MNDQQPPTIPTYRHLTHIMSNKSARIGLPFITLPQGGAILAGLTTGVLLKSLPLAAIIVLGGVVMFAMYQGEFFAVHVKNILVCAFLIRIKRPASIRIDYGWAQLMAAQSQKRPAAVYHLPGMAVVTSEEEDGK